MSLGYKIAWRYTSDVALNAVAAQKDGEFNPGCFKRHNAGSHVIGRAKGDVDECMFCSGLVHRHGDGFRLRKVSLDSFKPTLWFLFDTETWNGFAKVSHRQEHLCAVPLGSASGGKANVAGWPKDYCLDSGHCERYASILPARGSQPGSLVLCLEIEAALFSALFDMLAIEIHCLYS